MPCRASQSKTVRFNSMQSNSNTISNTISIESQTHQTVYELKDDREYYLKYISNTISKRAQIQLIISNTNANVFKVKDLEIDVFEKSKNLETRSLNILKIIHDYLR